MQDWYEKSFGEDYLIVYKHRDFSGAYEEVRSMVSWLDLRQGAKLFDLCCGMGRHALALHNFGYDVTGMDLSERLLREARERDKHSAVRWIRGDMRNIPLDETFDAVVNLFTSFGYFADDAENEQVISEISRILRPGGKFIIDFLNPEHVVNHLVPESERRDGKTIIQEKREIKSGFVQKQIVLLDGEGKGDPRVYWERVKLYQLPQFEKMTENNGLVIENVYGGYDKSEYDEKQSKRMIMVGVKGEAK